MKDLYVLAEFSSGPEITGTILGQMSLVAILNRVVGVRGTGITHANYDSHASVIFEI